VKTCIGLGRRPFSYSRRFGQEGGARTRYTLTGVGATSSRSCSALSVAASAGRPGAANVPSELRRAAEAVHDAIVGRSNTRSGQTAGKIVSASQGNREQLRSPESAVCANGAVDQARGKRGEIRARTGPDRANETSWTHAVEPNLGRWPPGSGRSYPGGRRVFTQAAAGRCAPWRSGSCRAWTQSGRVTCKTDLPEWASEFARELRREGDDFKSHQRSSTTTKPRSRSGRPRHM